MALPANVDYVTVHGQYVRADATYPIGTVAFAMPVELIDASAKTVILPETISVDIDEAAQGEFTVDLPTTNDPDLAPGGWAYTVTESWGSKYVLQVPTGSATIELALVDRGSKTSPVVGVAYATQAALIAEASQREQDDEDTLDAAKAYTDENVGSGSAGTVTSVNDVEPDEGGNIALAADDVGALADTYTPPAQSWGEITSKPSTFEPSAHTHVESDVTGLVASLAAKADSSSIPTTPNDIGAATEAQGALADSAVQDADLATIATSGSASDVTAGVLPVAYGGTGLVNASSADEGSYLRFGSGNTSLAAVAPAQVRSDIGALQVNGFGQPVIGTNDTVAGLVVTVANGASAPAGLPDGTVIVEEGA